MDETFEVGPEYARSRDEADPLASVYDRFYQPADEQYMDGNSLGPLSVDAEAAVEAVLAEWRDLAIRGWEAADPDWFHYGERLGDRMAPLLGAAPAECVVTGATTVNIHTLIGSFLDETGGDTVLANELDFPTDHYAIRAQLRHRDIDPDSGLRTVESHDGRTIEVDAVAKAIEDHEPDIVFMPSVLYRSGQLLDIERIVEAAHAHGAVAGFDLAHSVGVVPHALAEHDVDFAVWCSYKYLNGGPGAVGGLYVAEEHFDVRPALTGWWGHEKASQFDMQPRFTPAEDAGAWQISTPPVLAMAPLDGALDIVHEVGIEAIRAKSLAMTAYLIFLIDEFLDGQGYTVGTPRDSERRGGHVAVEHEEAYRISQALRDHGVTVDYRPPNVIRVCPTPLATRYMDIWAVAETLKTVVETEAFTEYESASSGVT
ncbi:MAG: kynureninase [Halodesulfurarchaeum sp.]